MCCLKKDWIWKIQSGKIIDFAIEKWKIGSMCYLRKNYIRRSNPTRNRQAMFCLKNVPQLQGLTDEVMSEVSFRGKGKHFFYFRQVHILPIVFINWKLLLLLVWEKLYFFGVADTIKNLGKHLKIQNAISIMLIILMPVKSPRVPPENKYLNLVM